jgi:UPF0271 protein
MTSIDLNCDMGELAELHEDGTQARLMQYVSSVNIACGAHAGDEHLIEATICEAMEAGVAIGAHPGYADRANFGRVPLAVSPEALIASLVSQMCTLGAISDRFGAKIAHVKPHGALYNVAVSDIAVAEAIASAVRQWGRDVALVGLAGSQMLAIFARSGFRTLSEAFADRRYEADGTLRSRKLPDALITDGEEAAQQVIGIVRDGAVTSLDGTRVRLRADTICLHSDTKGSADLAARVHAALRDAGIEVRSFSAAPASPRIPLP